MIKRVNPVALRIVSLYFGISSLYIIFVEFSLPLALSKVSLFPVIQDSLRAGFILFTSVFIYFLICKELRRRKKIEDDLLKAKTDAEKSAQIKSAFLANVSHEIRTPLNGILGFSELLIQPGITDQSLNKYVDIIKESSNQLLRTINQILDVSKIETQQLEFHCDEVNVTNLLRYLYARFIPEFERKQIEWVLSMPEPDQELLIFSDYDKLKHIFLNLIDNAIKYTEHGKVEFGFHWQDKNIQFFITDTGIGILPENQGLIFERFRQVEQGFSRVYGGVGLGLAITKSYVEMLGGNLQLKSEFGQGSTFSFSLPK